MAKALDDFARLVSIADAAAYPGIKVGQLRGIIATKRIAIFSVGSRILIPREALDLFIIEKHVATMPRRNSGARLRFLQKRQCFYVVWSESERSRERSTGTTDRKLAEATLADFLHVRTRDLGRVIPLRFS